MLNLSVGKNVHRVTDYICEHRVASIHPVCLVVTQHTQSHTQSHYNHAHHHTQAHTVTHRITTQLVTQSHIVTQQCIVTVTHAESHRVVTHTHTHCLHSHINTITQSHTLSF